MTFVEKSQFYRQLDTYAVLNGVDVKVAASNTTRVIINYVDG